MATKIYTKTGDNGSTSLIGGTKVLKSHIRIEAYGTVDELNSHIGLCRDLITEEHSRSLLLEIQDRLFTIGASLACDPEKEPGLRIPDLKEPDISLLEKEIDVMNDRVPPMKSFVLPGGHLTVSQLHIARCVCRRAERCCVQLAVESPGEDPIIIKYLNRLSDYLFVLSRYAAVLLHAEEIKWRARLG
jgi:cob(I)alamin adenosyltransferase